jgi:hypothetical protein
MHNIDEIVVNGDTKNTGVSKFANSKIQILKFL